MNPVIYKIFHLASVVILFGALGAAVYTPSNKTNKLAGILHGIALVLLLISGFGLLAKIWGNEFQWWVIAKLVIWFLLGGSYGLAKKRLISENAAFGFILFLGVLAAFFGNAPYLFVAGGN
ncbi:MAG: hypothetical protein Q7Q71_15480 [Verrucomicrobiota bacterium JB023]|nr:hypothetical protein [Verrucomicrobiota bacterium JB023]